MNIDKLKSVVLELDLKDYDLVFGIFMPTTSCDVCGGNGVKAWEDNGESIICDCLYEEGKEYINFGLLKKLLTITKSEV